MRFSIVFMLFLVWLPAGTLKAQGGNTKDLESSSKFIRASQILLQPSMLLDEASGNVCYSAECLVDEQSFTPDYDLHPVSEAWNPFKNNDKGQSIYIDLGERYDLSGIAFYNFEITEGLEISVGVPGNWEKVLSLSCDKPNYWEKTDINVSTRYIRLAVDKGSVVSANELILYGNLPDNSVNLKGGYFTNLVENIQEDLNQPVENDISINQNPVFDKLVLTLPEEDPDHIFTVEIYNLNGVKVLRREYVHNMSSRLIIDLSKSCGQCGVYILHYYNENGVSHTLKFIKRK